MSTASGMTAPWREPRRSPAVASATRREPPRAPVLDAPPRRGPSPRVVRRSPALVRRPRALDAAAPRARSARGVRRTSVVALATVALTGCGSTAGARIIDPPTSPVTVPAAAPRDQRRTPAPVRVIIPAIGVNAPLVRLGLDAHGALEVPERF